MVFLLIAPSALQEPTALGCDHNLSGAAVRGRRAALGQTPALELIDQQHHRAAIDAHRRAKLLLVCSLAGPDDVDEPEQGRRQADGLERARRAGVRCPPEPEEELTGELGDGCCGRRTRCHCVIFAHFLREQDNP